MLSPGLSYKQKIIPFLIILMACSSVAIAFDHHEGKGSFQCPVCEAKNQLQGTQHAVILEFNFTKSYYDAIKQLQSITPALSRPCAGRAPPERHHS